MPIKRVQIDRMAARAYPKTIIEPLVNRAELLRRLTSEWLGHSQEPRPDIINEVDRDGHVINIYVIWSEWNGLDALQRSEIIVDAFVAAENPVQFHCKVAIGVTPEEAKRMGLTSHAFAANQHVVGATCVRHVCR